MIDPQTTGLLAQLGVDAGTIESLLSTTIFLSLAALVAAIPTAIIARRKGRSRALWIVLALSIPIIPLLIVWLLPSLNPEQPPPEH